MILEIDKSYVKDFYKGDLKKCITKKDGLLWTDKRIKGAFNFGHGTKKDLKEYMEDNKKYAYFIEI